MSTSGGKGIAQAGNPFTTLSAIDGGMYSVAGALRRWATKARPANTVNTVAILAGDTAWTVGNFEGFNLSGSQKVYVGTEEVLVTAGLGTSAWTVIRAVNGTTAAGYAIGTRITSDPILRIAVLGDSTVQGTENGVTADGYAVKLARFVAEWLGLPLLSPVMGQGGFYPVYHSNDPNLGGGAGNGDPVWNASGGAWTLTTPGATTDRGPFGWTVTANGAANILQFAVPAYMGSIRCIDVYHVNQVLNGFSCDINLAGAWANAPGSGVAPAGGRIERARFVNGTDITNFRVRAATAAGAATSPIIIGIDCWASTPTLGTTAGVKLYNLGKDADFLGQFARANAAGDDFALLDGGGNDPGSFDADLVIIGSFTNDVLFWTNGVAYGQQLQAIISRCFPRSDIIMVGFAEQNGRSVTDQASLRAKCKQIAVANGVAGFDMYDAFVAEGIVGWAAANAAGYFSGDSNHFNALGVTEQAAQTSRLLRLA
jgi:hypothetical protein